MKSLFLIIPFSFTGISCAQIQGRVIDAARETPLEYATIAIYRNSDSTLVSGVITDENGSFVFNKIIRGKYYIEASFLGYSTETLTINVTTKNAHIKLGEVSLEPAGEFLEDVLITGEKATVLNKVDRQVFETSKFQNSQGGNVTDVIRNLPSVSINALGEISVRGSSGFVMLLNGKPIQGNASNLLNQLPANAVERVELITAPSAKFDPEGKAGLLNIITKKEVANGTYAQVNARGGLPSVEAYENKESPQRYGLDATVNKRSEKWNLSFGGSYQRNDISGRREGKVFIINEPEDKQTFLPSDGERSFDDISYNGRLSADFTPNYADTYSLGLYAGKHRKDRLADLHYFDNHAISPIGSGNRVYTFQYYNHNLRTRKADFALGSFDYAHNFKDASKLSTSFLYEYTFLGGPTHNDNLGFNDHNMVYQREYNTNDNPLHGVRFNLDYKFKAFPFGTLETGYQFRHLDHSGDFVYERDGVLVPEFSSNIDLKRIIHSGYLQLSGSKDKWDYAAGARLESMNRFYTEDLRTSDPAQTYKFDFVKLFPSASLQYALTEQTNLKAAYSKRIERTTTFKMNSFAEREHSEVFEQGDNKLKPEFIDLVELGINKKLKGNNSVYATSYYRYVANAINRVNTLAYETDSGAVIDTILNRVYSNVGKSKALGLEVGVQLKPTRDWSNFIGANIYKNNIDGAFKFKHRDGVLRNYEVNSDATIYSFNLNSTYSFWKNASAQFTLNYLSDTNTAQGEDSRFYSPNLSLKKSFLNGRLVANMQWQNIDMGLLKTNEQRITTSRRGEFYTTTNYIYEVDVLTLNLSYSFNNNKNQSKFIESEFGEREF